MQSSSGAKNPPWARSNVNTNITGLNPQIMDPNSMMTQQGMMPFQQTQTVFNTGMMQAQSGMGMPMAGQMQMNQMTQGQMYPGNVVAYPAPRGMNAGLYQNAQSNQPQQGTEQRVFTGTVTKTHNDFGFVDHDVFYQTSVCAKGIIPKVNDRVLVEATYNSNMPFKWNATRVQVLPKSNHTPKSNPPKSSSYNAVPPPSSKKPMPSRRDDRPSRRDDRKRSRTRSRSRSRERRDSRNRRDSPPRKRPVVHQPSPVKYVRVPRMPLDIQKADVPGLSQRYTNLYIPSDFFNAYVRWGETFPPQAPFSLNNPCSYHIMSREAENPNHNDTVLEPPDSDYRFSAKVMLISMPTLESLYQKCGLTRGDDKDKRVTKSPLHPTRLIKFLVGQKGKGGENFAIGGPWSPSLDGDNPQSDPGVLVKTAIRTCKALTGIDLSSCTQWYRMVEFYYWREGGGKSRLECVVLFLPDVWSAQPSRGDWTSVQERYKAACDATLRRLDGDEPQPEPERQGDATAQSGEHSAEKSQIDASSFDDTTITIDENYEDYELKPEPTHYSNINLRSLTVEQLKQELQARNASSTGLRTQLMSRLSKLLKTEKEKDGNEEDVMELEDDEAENKKEDAEQSENEQQEEENDTKAETQVENTPITQQEDNKIKDNPEEIEAPEKKEEKPKEPKTEKELEEEKKKLEKEKQAVKVRFELPSTPHIIVHPSNTAKNGKFTCSVATLSLLLDYRITDNKEHSFELFVFAELFNEMLMRDFGFYIYKTLYTLPEKTEDAKDKEKTDDKAEKKDEKKAEDKKDDKNNDKDRKDDKGRDSKRRERKDSHSDDERSSSPKRKSRGVDLPPDPYLLLSLVYFDTSRCGNISKKDLQNLFMSLGLQLSRSQIRAILEKVCIKDTFSYKVLIQAIKDLASGGAGDAMQDLPLDTPAAACDVPTHIAELEATIAAGNRELLPVFGKAVDQEGKEKSVTADVSDTGIVVYKSRVVDVRAMSAGAARAAGERARLEGALAAARAALRAARAAAASTQQAERGAQSQLADLAAQLAAAKARLTSLTASSKIFHSTLKSIQNKVEAVVNIKYDDDDDVVEIINGPSKEEKETKAEKKSEVEKEKDVKSTDKSDVKVDDKVQESVDKDKETEITSVYMDIDDRE
ncbi:PREDICTED: cell division cycle and apoptosis regulator protein 1-like [Papilio polytes]|uniref:cell division cycle and apoptosis regulator protein 1-like n=1 Tax=Papilio polytes TaxID=76194 RepID=UPI0006765D87|nr:PREDICTED: cell division cycle and apoptosis regulator protein 1-like [Papilio polytes]